jgi:hypothetical protein
VHCSRLDVGGACRASLRRSPRQRDRRRGPRGDDRTLGRRAAASLRSQKAGARVDAELTIASDDTHSSASVPSSWPRSTTRSECLRSTPRRAAPGLHRSGAQMSSRQVSMPASDGGGGSNSIGHQCPIRSKSARVQTRSRAPGNGRSPGKSEQSALLRRLLQIALIALHTREVAGSKPAAPMQNVAFSRHFSAAARRYVRVSAGFANASFLRGLGK